MREIKEGEFCRINGEIAKVIGKDDDNNILLDTQKIVTKQEIKKVKHSFNRIDLIEVGDIVEINNEKYEVIFDKSLDKLGILIPNRNYLAIRHSTLEHIFNKYRNIKILTHEQYEKCSYKVEEK